jgi:hypothetical protein
VDGITYTVAMPNINADTAVALNAYLQSVMVSNGHYLINTTTGDYVYYLEIVENPSFYAIQLNCYAMPTTITGYSYPSGATWTLTGTGNCPQFSFLPQATSNFNLVVGYNANTQYPATPQNTNYSITSVISPEINPVSALQLTCNLISNKFSSNNQNLYALGIPSVSFGQEIVVYPPNFAYNRITASNQYFVEVNITDQNGNPVYLQDPQILILLTVNEGSQIPTK